MAREDPHSYPGIGDAITAVLFLGTPHQGSPSAGYAKILAQTANAIPSACKLHVSLEKCAPTYCNR